MILDTCQRDFDLWNKSSSQKVPENRRSQKRSWFGPGSGVSLRLKRRDMRREWWGWRNVSLDPEAIDPGNGVLTTRHLRRGPGRPGWDGQGVLTDRGDALSMRPQRSTLLNHINLASDSPVGHLLTPAYRHSYDGAKKGPPFKTCRYFAVPLLPEVVTCQLHKGGIKLN